MKILAALRNRKFITLPQENTTSPYLVANHFVPHLLGLGLPSAVLLIGFLKLKLSMFYGLVLITFHLIG